MIHESQEEIQKAIRHFRLPIYEEITDVGLYLDQVTRYINEYMFPLGEEMAITSSMISNYVKRRLISSPVHKRYSRDQIASLICIAMIKSFLSLDQIYLLRHIDHENSTTAQSYACFRDELNLALEHVFEQKEAPAVDVSTDTMGDYRLLIHNIAMAAAHQIHLQICFSAISHFSGVPAPEKKGREKKAKEMERAEESEKDPEERVQKNLET